ncbi:hypothetical protein HanPI659440_Chr03g0126491 [Helianthus annuus]|nr:hypothetical protein HanPI659440_Chr03g0126491 [Helianthus annuus]
MFKISFILFLLLALSYIFCCATCLIFDRIIMPPHMRGRGGFATSQDHEAGPSHRRAPSTSHNTTANDLWRSFAEPARHSVSLSTSPSLPHSFGPHSENGPHDSHGSFIPLHQSPHHYPAPVYQGLYNPDAFLDEPVGHNPLEPEDHFSGGNEMEVDEDTEPSLPPSVTLLTIPLRYPMGHRLGDRPIMVLTAMSRGSGSTIGITPPATITLRCTSLTMVLQCTRSTTLNSSSFSSRPCSRTHLRPSGAT